MTQVRWGLLSTAAIGASDVVDAVYVALPKRAFAAAEAADRVCVEGFMWRHHPQTEYARRLLDDGAIGRLLLVRTALTVDVPEGDIRRTRSLGGGALGDLGLTHERRDELELVGSEGVLRIPDPWVGVSRHLGERVSAAIASGAPLPNGRDDAVAQAAVLEALATSARGGKPIEPRRYGVTA